MLTNKVFYDSAIYTNLQGLESLHHESKTNTAAVKKEVSEQFESLLIQMLLKSMRDTNKEFASGLMENEQSGFYNDLYDKQLSLVLSKSGLGIAKNIENYIDKNTASQASIQKEHRSNIPSLPTAPLSKTATKEGSVSFDSAADFVKNLWESAKVAASTLGADPKLLLAQAALETNWGKSIIPQADGKSTNNLFNIKADTKWLDEVGTLNTVEEKDGVLVKEQSKFRAYDSFQTSFMDYTHFLQNNSRYSDALSNADDPEKFMLSLQKASYATDQHYSEKVMAIYASPKFNHLFEELCLT